MRATAGSLRARLLVSGLLGMLLAAIAVAALLGAAFERSVLGNFDRRLGEDLLTLAGQVTSDAGGVARMRGEPLDTRYARALSGHYWFVETSSRDFRSRSLWDSALPASSVASMTSGISFETLDGPLGQTLRVASQRINIPAVTEPVTIRVASDVSETLADIVRFRWMAGIAGALVAAALLLVLIVQATYGLRPLRDITEALEALRNGKAREVDAKSFPREIRPLAEELNEVLVHNERMVERARTGAGDLAHALKTPLSVLLAAADRNDPKLPALVTEQVNRIRQDVDRHLAISLPADRQSRSNPADVVASLVKVLSSIYAERNLAFNARIDPGLEFHGNQADLEDMLGNLLDNACKWSKSNVNVEAVVADNAIRVTVSDDGPGIPKAKLESVTRRGKRLDETTPGSGLGLSIARALAESYGGTLELSANDPAGLCATLTLPGSD